MDTDQTVAGSTTRASFVLSAVTVLALVASGCSIAGPTYGTDKRVGEQLLEDLASVTTLKRDTPAIDYRPRPGLLPVPEGSALPAPQESVAKTNPAWENSPEELRRRLASEAARPGSSALQGVDTRSLAAQSKTYGAAAAPVDPATGKRVNMRLRAARIGSANTRDSLSAPPVEYRQAAATAPTGDLGTPEYKKERIRAKAVQGKTSPLGKLRDLLPF